MDTKIIALGPRAKPKKVSHGATFLNFDSIFGGGGVWILWSLTITS